MLIPGHALDDDSDGGLFPTSIMGKATYFMLQGNLGIDTSNGIWLLGQKTATDPSVYMYNHNLLFLTSRIYL